MRAKIVGATCIAVGAVGAWKNFNEGNVAFAFAAVALAAAGAYYMVRPTVRVLGAVEVLWGVLILLYFATRGGTMSFDTPRESGSSVGAVLGAILILAGIWNLVRRSATAQPRHPS